MTPRAYMLTGALAGLATCLIGLFQLDIMMLTVCFASGALFGKGYGISEARKSKEPKP